MPGVVLYFQVHQPYRLKRYTVFDEHPFYFDTPTDRSVCERVSARCYRPATRALLESAHRLGERFGVSLSLTGVVLEQLSQWSPDVIGLVRELVGTGRCELLGETSHHSLSFLYSRPEFLEQVALHERRIGETFGVSPRVFRNTELIYSDEVSHFLREQVRPDGSARYAGVLAEGVDPILAGRSPNRVYAPPGAPSAPGTTGAKGSFGLLLKNHRLSDDVAFRFSQRNWAEWPLTPEKFADWVAASVSAENPICNLFMDYETFGEHHAPESGIVAFLGELPDRLRERGLELLTPSEALAKHPAARSPSVGASADGTPEADDPVYACPEMTSWADTDRDLSAWAGNAMQSGSLSEVYRLERDVRRRLSLAVASGDEHEVFEARHLLNDWRRLTTSDHFYYMCTKHWADGDVHRYFSPYDSPYDAYINFMNVLDSIRARADATHLMPQR